MLHRLLSPEPYWNPAGEVQRETNYSLSLDKGIVMRTVSLIKDRDVVLIADLDFG
jgi:hypothetical protein